MAPRKIFHHMICICSIGYQRPSYPPAVSVKLKNQLSQQLKQNTQGEVFLFNTRIGMFVFIEKQSDQKKCIKQCLMFLSAINKNDLILHEKDYLFSQAFVEILTDKKVTPLGWKNFISSFLSQLDPFYGECVAIHGLFKKFVYLLKENGDERQLNYMKKRMNILRSRVSLDLSIN